MVLGFVIGGITAGGGLAGFITFLVMFIQSYSVSTDEWGTSVSSNGDYMVASLLFFFLTCVGAYQIYRTIKGQRSLHIWSLHLSIGSLISFIYALAMLIKAYNKGKPVNDYWVWTIVSIVLLAIFVVLYIILFKALKRKEQANS